MHIEFDDFCDAKITTVKRKMQLEIVKNPRFFEGFCNMPRWLERSHAFTARATVRSMTEGSPAWKPQATLAEVTKARSSGSRPSGYTPNQIIGIATELIDLVTNDLREDKNLAAAKAQESAETRPQA